MVVGYSHYCFSYLTTAGRLKTEMIQQLGFDDYFDDYFDDHWRSCYQVCAQMAE
jgi:hypothetical protein